MGIPNGPAVRGGGATNLAERDKSCACFVRRYVLGGWPTTLLAFELLVSWESSMSDRNSVIGALKVRLSR